VLAGIGLPLMFAVGKGWTDTQYFIFMLGQAQCLYVPIDELLQRCPGTAWVRR
jgi:GPH family glycoside/pentoside/hexuronide:cation symporter